MIRVPYSHMTFVWVSSHWDHHLEGLCLVKGKLHRFKCPYTTGRHRVIGHVFPLTALEKMKWLLRKRLFEICVGYHWTYPQRAKGEHYHLRNPRWLYQTLQSLYYWAKR